MTLLVGDEITDFMTTPWDEPPPHYEGDDCDECSECGDCCNPVSCELCEDCGS